MTSIKYKFSLITIILFIVNLTVSAQENSSHPSQRHLSEQKTAFYPKEKIYLHLNKPSYNYGDTIWFKAYAVTGPQHQLSAISNVLYVELFDIENNLLKHLTLHLTEGVAWGDISLESIHKPGAYRIRAYTNWMRNDEAFYDHFIYLGLNPGEVKQLNTRNDKPDVQFFPEGGTLINGVRTRIAFKAINSKGLGQDISGEIDDNEGSKIAEVSTAHLGMGVFFLTPQSGKTYTAKLVTPDGQSFNLSIPRATEKGSALTVNSTIDPDSLYIKIAMAPDEFQKQQNATFYLTANSEGNEYFRAKVNLTTPILGLRLDKKNFPGGIVVFTLFSDKGEPLNDRMVFVQKNDQINLNIAAKEPVSRTGNKVEVAVLASDFQNKPIIGTFSISVINESLTPNNSLEENTIVSNLLLTSDLRGYIEQPNYYFKNTNEQTNKYLDILMLTQGYSTYEWESSFNNKDTIIKYPAEKTLSILGTAYSANKKTIPKAKITLMATKENLFVDTVSNAEGEFKFNNIFLPDSTQITLRAHSESGAGDVYIKVQPPSFPVSVKYKESIPGQSEQTNRFVLSSNDQVAYKNYLTLRRQDSLRKNIELKQVEIKSYRPKVRDLSHSANIHGGGNADQIFMGEDLKGGFNLADDLTGKIVNVNIVNGIAHNGRAGGKPMVVILDGMILPPSSLQDVDVGDVYSVEVLKSIASFSIYGSTAPGGALIVTTKRGSDHNSIGEPARGLLTYKFNGFYKAHSFYKPKYTVQTDRSATDLRTAIYWEPNVITNIEGKASIDFFNSGTKGTYRIEIEGIDDNGNLGRQVFKYKVE
jgi:hypothetical protein